MKEQKADMEMRSIKREFLDLKKFFKDATTQEIDIEALKAEIQRINPYVWLFATAIFLT